MKKKIISICILISLLPQGIQASPIDLAGGVRNEYSYEEYIFLTGRPVLMKGTCEIRERERKGESTLTYRIRLEGEEGASLTRNISYRTEELPYKEIGQLTSTTEVQSYKEDIKIGGRDYQLKDYQFSRSDLLDARPASDFYEGNIIARKIYSIDGDQGQASLDISGGSVGYKNFWGSTETQILDNLLQVEYWGEASQEKDRRSSRDREEENFALNYSSQVSDSISKSLVYSGNQTSLSSIDGGFVKTSQQNMLAKYSYTIDGETRTKTLKKEMLPKVERMIVPKFRDVDGHWAEENIKKLYSLNVFDDTSSIFAPDAAMNRMEFTKAIIRASDMRVEEEKPSRRKKKDKDEKSYFIDVDIKNENYPYIKSGVDKEIIKGLSSYHFGPEENLTRAQAITILMRSLGYESKAPNPGYITQFHDDFKIPNWAKDSIYMAREIDLIQGDQLNRINPNQVLSRGEAATLAINYLRFLEKGLQRDYRDNIIRW